MRKRGQGGCHFLFVPTCVLVAQSWFLPCFSGTWCRWEVLVVFIAQWRGGEGELMGIVHNYMEIPSTVTHSVDAISCAGFNPCIPAGKLECDRADYHLLLPQQTGPSNANSRSSHSPGYGRVRYEGAPTRLPDLWTPSIKSGTQIT